MSQVCCHRQVRDAPYGTLADAPHPGLASGHLQRSHSRNNAGCTALDAGLLQGRVESIDTFAALTQSRMTSAKLIPSTNCIV